jgi:hypothetical protein
LPHGPDLQVGGQERNIPILAKVIDEGFLSHRLRSTSLAGIVGGRIENMARPSPKMILINRTNNPTVLRPIGRMCLAIAIVLRWFLPAIGSLGANLMPGARGLLLGISIRLNLAPAMPMIDQRCCGN